jgi:hypothetical protein
MSTIYDDFYVYEYLRKDGTPYYVGKGRGGRAFNKHRHRVKPPKDTNRIVFVAKNLSENLAFEMEKNLIKQYGRKDLGTGILINLTDGGEGTSGKIVSEETRQMWSLMRKGSTPWNVGKSHSEEAKSKMSDSAKKRKASVETKTKFSEMRKGEGNSFFGKHHTEEVRKHLSEINRGRKQSEETKEKKSQKLKGRKRPGHSERMKEYWKNKKDERSREQSV